MGRSAPPAIKDISVDDYVCAQMHRRRIPGLALAILEDGRDAKAKGYGVANLDLDVRVSRHTVFEIGSVTKQFTAACVMMLAEERKVGLDDTVSNYLDGVPESWRGITVRQCLNHTTGLHEYVGAAEFPSKDEFLPSISGLPLDYQPGESWAYSNTNYYVLGLIVERVSGRDFADFLDARILKPLGMSSTHSSAPTAIVKKRATGYSWQRDMWKIEPPVPPEAAFSVGYLLSNVVDLAKWASALNSSRLIRRETLDRMWMPAELRSAARHPYGFGWSLDWVRGHRVVRHGGNTPGFSADMSHFPDDGLTVIALTNLGGLDVDGITAGIAEQCVPSLGWSGYKRAPDPQPELAMGLRALLTGNTEGSPITSEFRTMLSTVYGAAMLSRFARLFSDLHALEYLGDERIDNQRICLYRATLGSGGRSSRGLAYVRAALSSAGEVAWIRVREA
jgi:CubicO group peptidase (beta-lactamase class C family)